MAGLDKSYPEHLGNHGSVPRVSHPLVGELEYVPLAMAEAQKSKDQHTSPFQAASSVSANIPLTKASHVVEPTVKE